MRNWGHSTLRVGVSLLWMSDCSVACQFAWRSRCGASPSGQATAAHRAPRSGPCLEACPRDPVPPTPSIPAVHFRLTWGFCTIRSLSSACRRRVAALMAQFPPFGGGFAPLGAFLRRVAGVSRLYWRNSPHPLLQQEDGVRRVAPLMVQFPRLLAVRLPFGAVRLRFAVGRRPHRRPPRRKTLTTGGCGRGVLRLGGSDAWPRVSLAREPLNMRVNPLIRTPTSRYARGRRCPSARREAQAASAPQRTVR